MINIPQSGQEQVEIVNFRHLINKPRRVLRKDIQGKLDQDMQINSVFPTRQKCSSEFSPNLTEIRSNSQTK